MVVAHPPEQAKLITLCQENYGLSGDLERLPGENLNFRLSAEDGSRYILKLAGDELPGPVIDLEHRMIEHLASAGIGLNLPRILPNRQGAVETQLQLEDGRLLRARLLQFVPGSAWCDAGEAGTVQLQDLGQACTGRRSRSWMIPSAGGWLSGFSTCTPPEHYHALPSCPIR
jgi:hydroxylysine kinase